MAREPGAEDQAKFQDNEYLIAINDSACLTVKVDGVVPNQPVLSASVAIPILSGAATRTVMTTTQHLVLADATAANFGVVLPSASLVAGRSYTIKKIDVSANLVFISGSSAQTVETAAFLTLNSLGESATVISDGLKWHVTAFYSGALGV